jgi:hypothetical protein
VRGWWMGREGELSARLEPRLVTGHPWRGFDEIIRGWFEIGGRSGWP